MSDNELSAVASVVGGSACPQADDTRAPAIALGTTRSTINALRTPMGREKTAHSTANALRTAHTTAKLPNGFTPAELLDSVGLLVVLTLLATQLLNNPATLMTLGHRQINVDSHARGVYVRT